MIHQFQQKNHIPSPNTYKDIQGLEDIMQSNTLSECDISEERIKELISFYRGSPIAEPIMKELSFCDNYPISCFSDLQRYKIVPYRAYKLSVTDMTTLMESAPDLAWLAAFSSVPVPDELVVNIWTANERTPCYGAIDLSCHTKNLQILSKLKGDNNFRLWRAYCSLYRRDIGEIAALRICEDMVKDPLAPAAQFLQVFSLTFNGSLDFQQKVHHLLKSLPDTLNDQ